jgi:hypothetical protein
VADLDDATVAELDDPVGHGSRDPQGWICEVGYVGRVSIAVPLDGLEAELGRWDFAYVLTTSDDGRPHAVALVPQVADGVLRLDAGGSTCRNATARPQIALVFPPPADGDGMSLLVDGDSVVEGSTVIMTPTWAVKHRPAPR